MITKSYPPAYSSVNSHLVWVFYDANAIDTSKTDYKYVAEVWIEGSKVHTERVYPRPAGAFGVFELSGIIRSYVNPVYLPTSEGVVAQQLAVGAFNTGDVVIKVREEYDGTLGSVVLEDSARVFFNHYNGLIAGFTVLSNYADKAATERGKTIDVLFTTKRYYIPYFATAAGSFNIKINGTTKAIVADDNNSLVLLNVSPYAINTDYPGTISSSATSYTVEIAGAVYTFNIVCPGMYTNYVLHWLGKFGGWESMLFNKPRKKTVDIERKEYQQLPYRIDDTTGVVSVQSENLMHEQRTVYSAVFTEKLKAQTDLLSDADFNWLAQLVQSPFVMLDDNTTVQPVVITNNNYEQKEYVLDRLNNLALDLDFTAKHNTQLR